MKPKTLANNHQISRVLLDLVANPIVHKPVVYSFPACYPGLAACFLYSRCSPANLLFGDCSLGMASHWLSCQELQLSVSNGEAKLLQLRCDFLRLEEPRSAAGFGNAFFLNGDFHKWGTPKWMVYNGELYN